MILCFCCLLTRIYDSVTVRNRRYNHIVRRYQNGRDKFLRDCRLSVDEQVCICFSNCLLFDFRFDYSENSYCFSSSSFVPIPLFPFQVAHLPIRYAMFSASTGFFLFPVVASTKSVLLKPYGVVFHRT